jgi:hypothetical protein
VTGDRPLPTRRLTPDEVLDGLRDLFTRTTAMAWEVALTEVQLHTPLADLVAIDGLDDRAVQLYFGTGPLPDSWWLRVWEFGTVGGLCAALAQFVDVPAVEPVMVAGRPCRASGAFLVIRAVLADAGVDVSELRPSSPLLPYVWVWPDAFRWELPRLAPGRVPPVRFAIRRLTRRIVGAVLGFGGLLFSVWIGQGFPVFGGVLAAVFVKVFLLDLLLAPWAARRRNWSVEFGTLKDFRDLATLIAEETEPVAAAA